MFGEGPRASVAQEVEWLAQQLKLCWFESHSLLVCCVLYKTLHQSAFCKFPHCGIHEVLFLLAKGYCASSLSLPLQPAPRRLVLAGVYSSCLLAQAGLHLEQINNLSQGHIECQTNII